LPILAAAELRLTTPLEITLVLTLLALLPAALASLTPFLRITLVLHFLRQALGTQTAPSNPVLLGLSLFLTLLVMQPVARDLQAKALEPYARNQMTLLQALEASRPTVQAFLLRFAREKDIQLFLELAKIPPPKRPQDVELRVLMPAYVLSELRTGFQIGAVLFLPFLIIDLVVASVTLSIGMVQLPPVMIAAPFKILLFVLVDGWNLVIGSLMRSFNG
jgi:flagellar biosynthetic protein FliP